MIKKKIRAKICGRILFKICIYKSIKRIEPLTFAQLPGSGNVTLVMGEFILRATRRAGRIEKDLRCFLFVDPVNVKYFTISSFVYRTSSDPNCSS